MPEELGDSKRPFLNVIVADYTSLAPLRPLAIRSAPDLHTSLMIGQAERDVVERKSARDVADALVQRLPRNDAQKNALIDTGYMLAQQISWEVVARELLLPAITR